MIKIIKTFLIVIFTVYFTLQANSETSYITKKDKTKNPVVKKAEIEKKENQWIKKKNVKEKKKKI